jgi:hypothetical protein
VQLNATQAAEAANHFNLSSTIIDNSYPRRPFECHLDSLDNFIVFREAKPRGCPSHLSRINPRFETSTHRSIDPSDSRSDTQGTTPQHHEHGELQESHTIGVVRSIVIICQRSNRTRRPHGEDTRGRIHERRPDCRCNGYSELAEC